MFVLFVILNFLDFLYLNESVSFALPKTHVCTYVCI